MANLGKALGAGLETYGAGMIKQGEVVGNMMYLTAAADKEAARKSGAAGAKAQHDTMLKYLDRLGSDVDALSKQWIAAIEADDESATAIGERLAKAESNLTAAWDHVLGRKPPKDEPPKTYIEEVTAYLKEYGIGDKLKLLNQDLLGDKSHPGSLKKIRSDLEKLHPNWGKLDEKTRTDIVNAIRDRIIAIKPEDIVTSTQVPTSPTEGTQIIAEIRESEAAAQQRGGWVMGALQDYSKRAPQNIPGATFNAAENARLLRQQIPSDVPANLEMDAGAQSSTSRDAFNRMMGSASGMGGMATDWEDDPAASAEARALARQQTQAQGEGQQPSPQEATQATLTQAPPDDVAAIKRFMARLLQLIEQMGQAEAIQAMAQQFRGLSPSQKQMLLADKQYGAAFKQLVR